MIASTQPLNAQARPLVSEPIASEARPVRQDADALPDFIRMPTPVPQTVFETGHEGENAHDQDAPPLSRRGVHVVGQRRKYQSQALMKPIWVRLKGDLKPLSSRIGILL